MLVNDLEIYIKAYEKILNDAKENKASAKNDFIEGMASGTINSFESALQHMNQLLIKAKQQEKLLEQYKTESQAYYALRSAL